MSNILDFLKPGIVFGTNVQKIFQIAKKYNFALPAVNCIGHTSINAVLETAAKVKSPVIIQFSYGGSLFISGKGLHCNSHTAAIYGAISAAKHVHRISKLYGIPVIIHTDHCGKKILPWIDGLLNAGEKYFFKHGKPLFSSHMIDLSSEPLEENINICKQYLKKMKKLDMTLEIELGCTGGEEDGIDNTHLDISNLYTQPKDVGYAWKKLNEISQNFIIAAAFGNVHGVYKSGNVQLKPEILKNSQKYISEKYNMPYNSLNFVFHGGSGSSSEDIQNAIKYGVVKMNIDTDIQWATWQGVLKYYKKNKFYLQTQLGNTKGYDQPNKKYYDPRSWLRHSQLEIVKRLEKTFKNLNAINIL